MTSEPQPELPLEASPSKVEPETLVLRGRPPRAIRFRRGVIASAAAIAVVSIAGTAWYALDPRSVDIAIASDENSTAPATPGETLATLPASYDNVPKLGPPLPGDLGKPILERQRQLASSPVSVDQTDAAHNLAQAEERRVAEVKAARESGLLVQSGAPVGPSTASAGEAAALAGHADEAASKLAIDTERDPNAQQAKADFVSRTDKAADINPSRVAPPPSPYTLMAGSVISASLITGLRSDLPGLVTAQVTERVYDSATGQTLLIPQGTRLIGSYDSIVAFGQRRALVVWQRIIFPDGSSLRLDNAPATDPSGYAGLADHVDFHTWELLKGVALSTLLGVGAELQFSGESDLVQALRQSTQQSAAQAGSQFTSRNLQVQPTITIRPGAPVCLLVHHDLVLRPWREQGMQAWSNERQ